MLEATGDLAAANTSDHRNAELANARELFESNQRTLNQSCSR